MAIWRETTETQQLNGTEPKKPRLPKRRIGYAIPMMLAGMSIGCLSDAVNGNTESLARAVLIGAVGGALAGILIDVHSSNRTGVNAAGNDDRYSRRVPRG